MAVIGPGLPKAARAGRSTVQISGIDLKSPGFAIPGRAPIKSLREQLDLI